MKNSDSKGEQNHLAICEKKIKDLIKSAKAADQENEEEINEDVIYETRVSNNLFSKLVIAEFANAFFAVISLILCILVYELRLKTEHYPDLDFTSTR